LTARLLTELKQRIKSLTLVPASGGCFEIKLGEQLIYSKLATGRFPDENEILNQLLKR
jgi:selenoprotein W-related protein